MSLIVQPTDATLGAIVKGVDLKVASEAEWKAVKAAFLEYGVLVFPAQHLSPDEQVDFASHFGEIETLTPNPDVKAVPISNRRLDGSLISEGEETTQILRGNEGWHTDSSYMPLAAKASSLSAHVVTGEGGETEWADMRAAYDELDPTTREKIEDLSAYHSLYYSQAKIGHHAKAGGLSGFHNEGAPLRPLVKTHPETGRKSLYLGRHAYGITGLCEAESEMLLEELVNAACQPPRLFSHRWEVGDLAIWDNRCLLHRARPYDYDQPRHLVHARIAGDPSTELAQTSTHHR
jgi:alpha-ketoglutarate-dependent taurine dioxygenase